MDARGCRVLAIDTSTAFGSVAIAEGQELIGEVRLHSVDSHSMRVLPAAAFLLEQAGWAAREIDGFAVTSGPGSFTGLRVGLASVQGLALAAGRPCLGVSTLDVLAARIAGAAESLMPLVDAYRGEVFGALYDGRGHSCGEPFVAPPEALADRMPAGVTLVGTGAERHREWIRTHRPDATFSRRSPFLAGALARLAVPRFAAGEGVTPAALRPLYLREAEIRAARS